MKKQWMAGLFVAILLMAGIACTKKEEAPVTPPPAAVDAQAAGTNATAPTTPPPVNAAPTAAPDANTPPPAAGAPAGK